MFTTEIIKCFSELDENTSASIRQLIEKADRIVILTHHNPDGDAVGSSLGLWQALQGKGKQVQVILPDHAPEFLHWLPAYDQVVSFEEAANQVRQFTYEAELIFYLDFSESNRLGPAEELCQNNQAAGIILDHHPSKEPFADYNLISTKKGSAAEIVFGFLEHFEIVDLLDQGGATCLLAGIITDTLGFKVSSSYPELFDVTMKLMRMGAEKDRIFEEVYNQFSLDRMRLLGFSLTSRMKLYPNFGAASIYLSRDDMNAYNYKKGDTEGFVNYPLSIKGISIVAFFTEQADHIKLSLRSKGDVAVNELAKEYFNGGGHRNAAGGKFSGTMEEAINRFEYIISQ